MSELGSTRKLYFFYQTNKIYVSREILVMGFYDLISAWGGTMGLFLGFSFLTSVYSILDTVENCLTNNTNK
jgi:hypothetical protein